MDSQRVEAQYQQVAAMVRAEGLAVITGEGGNGLAPVAYSVGAAAHKMPDMIIYGLPSQIAAAAINNAFNVVKENWPFPSRSRFAGVIENYEVALRDVSKSDLLERIMFLTNLYNGRNDLDQTPILQICWPDASGKMPFEAGCDPAVARGQRIPSLRN